MSADKWREKFEAVLLADDGDWQHEQSATLDALEAILLEAVAEARADAFEEAAHLIWSLSKSRAPFDGPEQIRALKESGAVLVPAGADLPQLYRDRIHELRRLKTQLAAVTEQRDELSRRYEGEGADAWDVAEEEKVRADKAEAALAAVEKERDEALKLLEGK